MSPASRDYSRNCRREWINVKFCILMFSVLENKFFFFFLRFIKPISVELTRKQEYKFCALRFLGKCRQQHAGVSDLTIVMSIFRGKNNLCLLRSLTSSKSFQSLSHSVKCFIREICVYLKVLLQTRNIQQCTEFSKIKVRKTKRFFEQSILQRK